MRFWLGLILFAVGLFGWLGSMMIDPYNTLGVGPEYIRRGIPESIQNAAGIAALLFLVSALITYSKPENRRGWKGISFAITLLFFTGTALARVISIQFFVLA